MAINSLSASSYGLSGLVSGMNTQEMVEKLLSGTQMKIDSTAQKKTSLEYKQQMYRDVMAKLTALQSSFLSFTSSTNLLSNSFYNSMSTSITSPIAGMPAAFSVTGSSTAQPGTVTMDYIKQLATARTAKTGFDATGEVAGKVAPNPAQQLVDAYRGNKATMVIKVGSKIVEIDDVAAKFGGKPPADVAEQINQAMATAGIDAEARFVNNKLQIKAGDKDDYITILSKDSSNALATKMFGMVEMSGQGTLNASIDTDAYQPSFAVNLDGRQQNIRLDINRLRAYANATDPADIAAAEADLVYGNGGINDQLQRYFGSGVSASLANGTIQFESGGKSQNFTITGNLKTMSTLGLDTGVSNKLNTGMKLKDLNFGVELEGNQHTFSINGVQFSYTADPTLSTVMNDINNSKAGVKISYLASEDRFVIQNSETGAGSKDFMDSIEQTEGNLMSVLFGAKGSGVSQGAAITVDMVSETVSAADIKDGGTFTFNVNGVDRKFTISHDEDEGPFTLETFAQEMNKAFKSTYGVMADGTQKITFTTEDGKFVIRANDNETVVQAVRENKETNTNMLGFAEKQDNIAADGATVTLADAGIEFGAGSGISINVNGTTVTLAADELVDVGTPGTPNMKTLNDMTLDEVAIALNTKIAGTGEVDANGNAPTVEFDDNTGAFRLMGVDIPMEITITGDSPASANLEKLFGDDSIAINKTFDVAAYNAAHAGEAGFVALGTDDLLKETDEGQNAIFSINGSQMERASNTFTVEGLTYTLNDITPTETDPDTGIVTSLQAGTKVTVSRDTEKIVEGINEFLKLYNETIDTCTKPTPPTRTIRRLPPSKKRR